MGKSQKLLASNAIGAISLDSDQDKLNIGLGTVMLSFSTEDSKLFYKTLSEAKCKMCKCSRGCNKVFIQTPLQNLQICLSKDELEHGLTLLEWSFLQMEIDEILA